MLKRLLLLTLCFVLFLYGCKEDEKSLPNKGTWKRIADFPIDVPGGLSFIHLFSIKNEAVFAVNHTINGVQIWVYNEKEDFWIRKKNIDFGLGGGTLPIQFKFEANNK